MSKGVTLMKSAQNEKTKQTVEQLVEWYSTKEEFYKVYVPIQQSLAKKLFHATENTIARLKEISQIVKEEREIQAIIFQKSEKNVLSDESRFHPKIQETESKDPKGSKIKVQLPPWSSNIDRIFISLSKHQKEKQGQIKKVYKALEGIEQSVSKEEGRYKSQVKRFEKQVQNLFSKLDEAEKDQSKVLGKLIKETKNDQIKDSAYFIGELKKIENFVMSEITLFADRSKKLLEFIQAIIKLEKQVAKKIKEEMTSFLNYRKVYLGVDTKRQQDVWGQVTLCEQKIQIERVSYFNKILLKPEKIEVLKKIMPPNFEPKNNWQVVIQFLQTSRSALVDMLKAEKSMFSFLKNISYRCWTSISLARGWLIESYTPSVMYMTYDYIMLIYSMEGEFLKKIQTNQSKVKKVEENTVFLQENVKGFFTDSLEEYKVRFEDLERMQEFQLFMENQIS